MYSDQISGVADTVEKTENCQLIFTQVILSYTRASISFMLNARN